MNKNEMDGRWDALSGINNEAILELQFVLEYQEYTTSQTDRNMHKAKRPWERNEIIFLNAAEFFHFLLNLFDFSPFCFLTLKFFLFTFVYFFYFCYF